jgi:hypothetical protein
MSPSNSTIRQGKESLPVGPGSRENLSPWRKIGTITLMTSAEVTKATGSEVAVVEI